MKKEGKFINIMEVCPRDGWQNLPDILPTETKKYLIKKMLDSGIKKMQICSFVSPKAIPQMYDAKESPIQHPQKNKNYITLEKRKNTP